jgi:hypothetical protein
MAELKIEIDFTDYEIHINEYVKSCFQAFKEAIKYEDRTKEEVLECINEAIDEFDQRIALCRAQQLLK